MKIVPACFFAALAIVTATTSATAAPANSAPGASNIDPAHQDQFWTPQRKAEWNSGYPACMRLCQEIGWTSTEAAVYCNARWNHQFNANRLIPAYERFGK